MQDKFIIHQIDIQLEIEKMRTSVQLTEQLVWYLNGELTEQLEVCLDEQLERVLGEQLGDELILELNN